MHNTKKKSDWLQSDFFVLLIEKLALTGELLCL